MDDSLYCRPVVRKVNDKKSELIKQIQRTKKLKNKDNKDQVLPATNIHHPKQKWKEKYIQENINNVDSEAVEEKKNKKTDKNLNKIYSFATKTNELLDDFKVINGKPQNEVETRNGIVKKRNRKHEGKEDKIKRYENEEVEEKEEKDGGNGLQDEKVDDINERNLTNKYDNKKETTSKKNHKCIEEETVKREIHPGVGDLNNNDEDDYGNWYIRPPKSESPTDEVKISAIKKVFLARLKKNSSITSQNTDINDKNHTGNKTTSPEHVSLDHYNSEYTDDKVNKGQYSQGNNKLRRKKEKKEKIFKHVCRKATSDKTSVTATSMNLISKNKTTNLQPNYVQASVREEFGSSKRKLEEDDTKELEKKYDESVKKRLKTQHTSNTLVKYSRSIETAKELGNPIKKKLKYFEKNHKEIKNRDKYLKETRRGEEEWATHSNQSQQSNKDSSKYEYDNDTRLVLRKVKVNSNEIYVTHTCKSLIKNNSEKEENNMLIAKSETSKHSSKNKKLKVQDKEGKVSQRAIRSNVETINSKRSKHKLDHKYRNFSEQTDSKTDKRKYRREKLRYPNSNLSNQTEKSKKTNNRRNVVVDKMSDVIDKEREPMKCDVTPLRGQIHVALAKNILGVENGSRNKVERNREINGSEKTKMKLYLPQTHSDAFVQSETPRKSNVKNIVNRIAKSEALKETKNTAKISHKIKIKQRPNNNECVKTTSKKSGTSSKRPDHSRELSLGPKEHYNMTHKYQTQKAQTSVSVKNDSSANHKPSLKVSLSLSVLGDDWLKPKVVHTNASPHCSKNKKRSASIDLIDLNEQSQSLAVKNYEPAKFDEHANHSISTIKNSCNSLVNIIHTKKAGKLRIRDKSTESIKNKPDKKRKVIDMDLNISGISTEASNLADETISSKLTPGRSSEKVHEFNVSSTKNEKIKKRKTCHNLSKTNDDRHSNNVRRKVVSYNTSKRLFDKWHIYKQINYLCVVKTRPLKIYKTANKSETVNKVLDPNKNYKTNKTAKYRMKIGGSPGRFVIKESLQLENVSHTDDTSVESKTEDILGSQINSIALDTNEKIEKEELCSQEPFKLVDRSGIVEKGVGVKPYCSSTQCYKGNKSPIKYQRPSSCLDNNDLSPENAFNAMTRSNHKLDVTLLNPTLASRDDTCVNAKTCFVTVDLPQSARGTTSPKGCLTYGFEANVQRTIHEVEKGGTNLKDVVKQPAEQLVSGTVIQYKSRSRNGEFYCNFIKDQNTRMMNSVNNLKRLSIYEDLSSTPLSARKHSFEHLKSISNYIIQRLLENSTDNAILFFLQNKYLFNVCLKEQTSSLLPQEKELKISFDPFYGLKLKSKGVIANCNLTPKLILTDSPNLNYYSTFINPVSDQLFNETNRKITIVLSEDKDKKEPKPFRISPLQQNCINTKYTDRNHIEESYENDEDVNNFFSKISDSNSSQNKSEQTNSKSDLRINNNKDVYDLDAHVTLLSQMCIERKNKNKGEHRTRSCVSATFLSTDIGRREKNQSHNNCEIKNVSNMKCQLNQDENHYSHLVTTHFQKEINKEYVENPGFNHKTKHDDTDIPNEIVGKHAEKSEKKSNNEYKCNEIEVIDLDTYEFTGKLYTGQINENNETRMQARNTCIVRPRYRPRRINLDNYKNEKILNKISSKQCAIKVSSKSHLNEENGIGEGVVRNNSDQEIHLRNGNAKRDISFFEEDTVLYIPNESDTNCMQENGTINDKTELECSNTFRNVLKCQDVLSKKQNSMVVVETQNNYSDTDFSCDDMSTIYNINFGRPISAGNDTEIQLKINRAKQDFIKYYKLVFDNRIKYSCLKMGMLIYQKIQVEMNAKMKPSSKSENCLITKQNNMSSNGDSDISQNKTSWNYFVEFYDKICGMNIDENMQQLLLVAWFSRVHEQVSKLSLLKYSVRRTKQKLLESFPIFSFKIPIVADFLHKEEETLIRYSSIIGKLIKASSKRTRNHASQTTTNIELCMTTK